MLVLWRKPTGDACWMCGIPVEFTVNGYLLLLLLYGTCPDKPLCYELVTSSSTVDGFFISLYLSWTTPMMNTNLRSPGTHWLAVLWTTTTAPRLMSSSWYYAWQYTHRLCLRLVTVLYSILSVYVSHLNFKLRKRMYVLLMLELAGGQFIFGRSFWGLLRCSFRVTTRCNDHMQSVDASTRSGLGHPSEDEFLELFVNRNCDKPTHSRFNAKV